MNVPVKTLLYCYGSRGDVEPMIALAQAIRRAGGEVMLAAPRSLVGWIESQGVQAAGLRDDVWQRVSSPDVRRMFEGSGSKRERKETARALMHESAREYGAILADVADIAETHGPADVVVHTQGLAEATHQVGEWLGVPSVLATLFPHYARSACYPSMMLAGVRWTGPVVNRASHVVSDLVPPSALFLRQLRTWRKSRLGLTARPQDWNFRRDPSGNPKRVLHAFSPTLLRAAEDWGASVSTRGFWFTTAAEPDVRTELGEYLEATPSLVVSLGSLRPSDELGVDTALRSLARTCGLHLLVISGTSDVQVESSDRVRVVRDVPFSWLLPRASAVIHAGGAGVSHHALRAGVPQIPLPIHAEQMFWSRNLTRIGVASEPVPMRAVTVDALARAVHQATEKTVVRAAAKASHAVRSEAGADGAVRDLGRWVDR